MSRQAKENKEAEQLRARIAELEKENARLMTEHVLKHSANQEPVNTDAPTVEACDALAKEEAQQALRPTIKLEDASAHIRAQVII